MTSAGPKAQALGTSPARRPFLRSGKRSELEAAWSPTQYIGAARPSVAQCGVCRPRDCQLRHKPHKAVCAQLQGPGPPPRGRGSARLIRAGRVGLWLQPAPLRLPRGPHQPCRLAVFGVLRRYGRLLEFQAEHRIKWNRLLPGSSLRGTSGKLY